jgi:hypothetical protein
MTSPAQNKRSGQAMLIAVLSLGGAILGATAIAGFLTLYQIRTTTDSANSAKAIFAADSGVEWAQFNYYCSTDMPSRCPGVTPGVNDYPTSSFSNGVVVSVDCYDTYAASGSSTVCSDPATLAAISTGISMDSERAFFLGVSGSTTTYP